MPRRSDVRALAGALAVLVLMQGGCTATYQREVISTPAVVLERGKAVLIGTPKNGSYESKEYVSSGSQTANAVKAAFARYSNDVAISRCPDRDCLLAEAGSKYAYLIVPEILHWEDRNTEWSGKPDRLEIKLIVIDALNRADIASVVLNGKSKWATFGGDHPEDLLPEPVSDYVATLYK